MVILGRNRPGGSKGWRVDEGHMVWVIDQVATALGLFGQVAGNDPVAPLLLLVAASIMAVSVGVFGFLAVGGIASLFTSGFLE